MARRWNGPRSARSPERDQQVCRDYHPGGMTIREIAALRKFGVTTVHTILVDYGIRRRPPGNHRKTKQRRGPGYDSEVAAAYTAGEPLESIRRRMRTSRRLIEDVVRDLRLSPRRPIVRKDLRAALLSGKTQS